MKKILQYFSWLLVISYWLLVTGCARKNILAKVGTRKITVEEFQERLKEIPAYYLGFLGTRGGQKIFLDGWIREEILIQQAKREGLHRRPEIKKKFKAFEEQLLLEAMVEELKKDRINISDQELQDYYLKKKQEFLSPEQVRARHILFRTKNEAEKVLEKLKAGEKFAALAKKYSLDSVTGPKGGDIGYFSRGEMVPGFDQAVFDLKKVGDIAGPIKTQFGWHIAKLTGRKRKKKKSEEEARAEIKKILQKDKFDSVIERYRKLLDVNVNYEMLEKVKYPADRVHLGREKKELRKSDKKTD